MIVIEPGSRVTLPGDWPGTCTAVAVYTGGRVVYQVAWWNGRQREERWLDASEVTAGDAETMKIGFEKQ